MVAKNPGNPKLKNRKKKLPEDDDKRTKIVAWGAAVSSCPNEPSSPAIAG